MRNQGNVNRDDEFAQYAAALDNRPRRTEPTFGASSSSSGGYSGMTAEMRDKLKNAKSISSADFDLGGVGFFPSLELVQSVIYWSRK